MHRARLSWWIPVAVLMAGTIGVLSGCKVIGDPGASISLERSATAACIKECNEGHLEDIKDEIDRHQSEIEDCQSLSGSERDNCMEAEGDRHELAMQQIAEGRKDCRNNCHRQGNGNAHGH